MMTEGPRIDWKWKKEGKKEEKREKTFQTSTLCMPIAWQEKSLVPLKNTMYFSHTSKSTANSKPKQTPNNNKQTKKTPL